MPDVVATLPEALRAELKDPLGTIYTDAETLLSTAGEPIVAVGDVVTLHLLRAGHVPSVAVVDGRTERTPIDAAQREEIAGFDRRVDVANPAATLTAELLATLRDAIGDGGTVLVVVDGEEDLAVLPAALVAPDGATLVYGQPGEGMVLADVDDALRERCRDLLARMDGEYDRLAAILEG